MFRKLILLMALALVCASGFAQPAQYLHGLIGGGDGGGTVVASITGQVEVIATYGETITAGDMVIGRFTNSYVYDMAGYDLVENVSLTPMFAEVNSTSNSLYGQCANMSPNGNLLLASYGDSADNLYVLFQKDGNGEFQAVQQLASSTFGTSWNTPSRIEWSPQNDMVVVTYNGTVYINAFKVSYPGGVAHLDEVAISGTPMNVVPLNASWSPQGNYFLANTSVSPFMYVYQRIGDTLTKLPNPATLPLSYSYGGRFSPNEKNLVIADSGANIAPAVYTVSGSTITYVGRLPSAASYAFDSAFSRDGSLLLSSNSTSPQLWKVTYDGSGYASYALTTTVPISGTGLTGVRRVEWLAQDTAFVLSHDAGSSWVFSVDNSGASPAMGFITTFTGYAKSRLANVDYFYGGARNTSNPRHTWYKIHYSSNIIPDGSTESVFKFGGNWPDMWNANLVGYAKESGTVGQQKTVIKLLGQ